MNSEWQERMVTISFTEEMARAYDYEWDEDFPELLELKAKQLEDTINGIVIVSDSTPESLGTGGTYEVKCIHSRSASRDIIKRQLENLQTEVMKTMDTGEGYWG